MAIPKRVQTPPLTSYWVVLEFYKCLILHGGSTLIIDNACKSAGDAVKKVTDTTVDKNALELQTTMKKDKLNMARQAPGNTLCIFIYLGFYVTFNTVQVTSRWVVGRTEETSTYSSSGFCTVTADQRQATTSFPQRWEARVLPLCHHGPYFMYKSEYTIVWLHTHLWAKKPGN